MKKKTTKRGSRLVIGGAVWHVRQSPEEVIRDIYSAQVHKFTSQTGEPVWIRSRSIDMITASSYRVKG